MMSPSSVLEFKIAPTGSSIAVVEPKVGKLNRNGGILRMIFVTLECLSRKIISIENLIKKVWIDEQGLMTNPPLFSKPSLPRSPTTLFQKVSTIVALSAMREFLVTFTICINILTVSVAATFVERWENLGLTLVPLYIELSLHRRDLSSHKELPGYNESLT